MNSYQDDSSRDGNIVQKIRRRVEFDPTVDPLAAYVKNIPPCAAPGGRYADTTGGHKKESVATQEEEPVTEEELSPIEEESASHEEESGVIEDVLAVISEESAVFAEEATVDKDVSIDINDGKSPAIEEDDYVNKPAATSKEESTTIGDKISAIEVQSVVSVDISIVEQESPVIEKKLDSVEDKSVDNEDDSTETKEKSTAIKKVSIVISDDNVDLEKKPATIEDELAAIEEELAAIQEESAAIEEDSGTVMDSEFDSGSVSPGEVEVWSDSEATPSVDLDLTLGGGEENVAAAVQNDGKAEESDQYSLRNDVGLEKDDGGQTPGLSPSSSVDSFESVKSGHSPGGNSDVDPDKSR